MGMEKLAQAVRRRMEDAGLNPKRLSLKAGLNETYVRDILKARSQNPRHEHLAKLATALETTLSEMLGDSDAQSVPASPAASAPSRFWPGYDKRLQAIRLALGFRTPVDFADRLGLPSGMVQAWEKGRSEPDLDAVMLMKQRCDVSADYVLFGESRALSVPMLQRLLDLGYGAHAPEAAAVPALSDPGMRRTARDQPDARIESEGRVSKRELNEPPPRLPEG